MTAQDQQSRAELLPCPFCGSEAKMSHSRDGEVCNVRCAGWNVGNCLGAGPNCYTEAEAIAGWNRRAPADQAARALPATSSVSNAGSGNQWKCGSEFALYHSDASHVSPEYRAGWNDCYTAAQVQAMGRVPLDTVEAMKLGMAADDATRKHCRGTTNWAYAMTRFYEAALAAAPRPPAAQEAKSENPTLPAAQERKPLFWVRLLRDGLYEGPVHANSVGGKMMRDEKPDEWHPLYLGTIQATHGITGGSNGAEPG